MRSYMSNHNISGAGSGQLSTNLISRVEGLAEKSVVETTQNMKVLLVVPTENTEGQATLSRPSQDLIEGDDWNII